LDQNMEAIVEWIIQHIDDIFRKHPELAEKLYEKLKTAFEVRLATKEDILTVLKELKALREDFNRLGEEVKVLREDFNRLSIEVKALREDFNKVSIALTLRMDALGAHWGIMTKNAFRKSMKYIVEKYFGGSVNRWEYYDEEGFVYGVKSIIDVDVLVKDDKHLLIEIKSRIDASDVAVFRRKAQLYERVTKVKPDLIMISPYVTDKALKLADKLGIKIIKGIPGY